MLGLLAVNGEIGSAQAAFDRNPLTSVGVPRTIHDAVLRRLVRVSPSAQRLARLAAVAGRHFDFSLLQALLGEDEPAVLDQIRELLAAQLIVEESAERFAFRHALTRQAIYAQLLARERHGLHRAIADALERRDPVDAHLADLAYHHYRAGNWRKVLLYAPRMAERAQAMHAPRAAIEHYSHAIEAADALQQPPPPVLLRARGATFELQGEFTSAEADYARAVATTRAAGDGPAEWQLLLDLGFLWLARDLRRAGEFFRQALELAQVLGDPARIAQSQNRLGNWYVNMDQPAPSMDLHRRALASFAMAGDRRGAAQTLDLLALATYVGGDRRQAIDAFEQSAEEFRTIDDGRALASVLATMGHLRCATHVYDTLPGAEPAGDRALSECQEALNLARALGWRPGEAYASCELAACLSAEGEYGRAFAAVREGQAIAEELEHRGWLAVAHATRGFLELDLLDATSARQDFERAEAEARLVGSVHLHGIATALLALACLLERDGSRAETMLRAAVDPSAPVATLTQSLLLATLGEALLARGDARVALDLADRLIGWARTADGTGVVPRLEKLRGDALTALGQNAAAEDVLRAAAEAAHRQAARPLLWRIYVSLGQVLQRQARRGEAEQTYAAARELVSELATALPDERAQLFQARALSLMPAPRPVSQLRAARTASGGLTARERQVAALIGRGLTNSEIAERLVVSVRTVESHIGHIRDKLSFTSRAQLVAWAIDRRLVQPSASE